MSAEAYPLKWPAGWPRTPASARKSPVFKVSISEALDHMYGELERLGARDVVVSSSMQVRLDGRPLAHSRTPEDPGVAVYFSLKGSQQCIPCDKWSTVLGNIRAVGLTVEALRGLERWGAKEMVDAAFQGFRALPAPPPARDGLEPWWSVLGVEREAPESLIKARFRILAHQHHPDKGGDPEEFKRISNAYTQAIKEVA